MSSKQASQKRRGTAMSDQWMDFAEKGFDADEYAESFFLTHAETEADDRCTELTNLRYHTQDLLRQKVSSHYQLFMRGTEDIQHVEQDLAQLRKLVSRLQDSLKLLDGASASILGFNHSKADKPSSARPTSVSFDHGNNAFGRPVSRSIIFNSSSSSNDSAPSVAASRLPKWVVAVPEDLQRLVVEKQRSQAVTLIEKVRTYFAQSKHNSGTDNEILTLVNKKADEVAERIIQDLEEMARTILYDFRDMNKQLKMLIILGKPSTAVAFFIRNRGGIIERSLRLLEAGGDPLSYVTLLTDKFFDLLTGACAAFNNLFNAEGQAQGEAAQSFSRLVIWVDSEVRRYATLVGRQLSATRRDLLDNQPAIMKDKDAHHTDAYGLTSPTTAGSMGGAPLPPHSPRASAIVSPQEFLSASRSNQLSKMASMSPTSASRRRGAGLLGGSSASVVYDECFLTIGACLEVCFSLAGRMDKLGLPVKPTLARVLSDDLTDLLVGYARSITSRVEKEAQDEPRTPVTMAAMDLVLQTASSFAETHDGGDEGEADVPPPLRLHQPAPARHHKQQQRSQLTDLPLGDATVLGSAGTLVTELNSLVANFVLLKAPREAQVQYSSDLSLLDPVLVREMYGVLSAYPTALEKRWGPTRQKKRPTLEDLKDLSVVADTLQAVYEVTLPLMDSTWLDDPVLLADADEMRVRLEQVRGLYGDAMGSFVEERKPKPPPPKQLVAPPPAPAAAPSSGDGNKGPGHQPRPSVAGERATTPTGRLTPTRLMGAFLG